ncbi:hypothetical protein ACYEXS_36250 [Paenibacillus sp. MAH-36]|uniref:Uncharacterized protein n=1 Tax=Paenibacillus violae TaxID=3077234 RepID=A0ABU3RPS2_9BACL|nr:hypothetical protein [Paenibacillus sp. PFR10]MDU0206284.1 hypothetical protein [Paenibacillus sp. PFR10]
MRDIHKPNMGLRIAYIIPNVFMYILIFGLSVFVFTSVEELKDVNRLEIWLFNLVILLLAALFGSYRIWSWVKRGKL